MDRAEKEYQSYDRVTEVLRAEGFMGLFIPESLDWYMDRGTQVHLATELWDKGTLDESTLDDDIRGYIESWKKFRAGQSPYAEDEIELTLYDHVYKFRGTLDRIDLDIKTGGPASWHIYQLGAYSYLARANKLPTAPDKVVYLDANGGYPKVKIYSKLDIMRASETFLCALNVYRAKLEMKINE